MIKNYVNNRNEYLSFVAVFFSFVLKQNTVEITGMKQNCIKQVNTLQVLIQPLSILFILQKNFKL